MARTRKLPPTKRIKAIRIIEVGYFAKDGYFSPKVPGVPTIELPWPYFRPGEKVLVEVTKIATRSEARVPKGGNNGKRRTELAKASPGDHREAEPDVEGVDR